LADQALRVLQDSRPGPASQADLYQAPTDSGFFPEAGVDNRAPAQGFARAGPGPPLCLPEALACNVQLCSLGGLSWPQPQECPSRLGKSLVRNKPTDPNFTGPKPSDVVVASTSPAPAKAILGYGVDEKPLIQAVGAEAAGYLNFWPQGPRLTGSEARITSGMAPNKQLFAALPKKSPPEIPSRLIQNPAPRPRVSFFSTLHEQCHPRRLLFPAPKAFTSSSTTPHNPQEKKRTLASRPPPNVQFHFHARDKRVLGLISRSLGSRLGRGIHFSGTSLSQA